MGPLNTKRVSATRRKHREAGSAEGLAGDQDPLAAGIAKTFDLPVKLLFAEEHWRAA